MMKKMIKALPVLLAAVLLFSLMTVSVSAGTVTYDGTAQEFVFAPGSEQSPTDLFENFKNVMPGDTLEQEIVVKNTASDKVQVQIYLRSLGADAKTTDLLSKMHMTVTAVDGDKKLYDAPADQTAQLTEWTSLGKFDTGAAMKLKVTLQVPIELDNSYQEVSDSITWEFKADEIPVEVPSDPTGDATNVWLWIVVLAVSAVAVLLLILFGRKKKNDQ